MVVRTPTPKGPPSVPKGPAEMKNQFTKLEVNCKTLIYQGTELVRRFRLGEGSDERLRVANLIMVVRRSLEEMSGMAEDMNAVTDQKISSPRIVDQAKTFTLTVENLKGSLRQLQRELTLAVTAKERADLLSLSRSPFENGNGIRRRGGAAAEISSGATESMIHSRRILWETVQRGAGTIEALANSSGSLHGNQEELNSQMSLISVSKKLLTKYGRREFTDKLLICLALVFFLACVMYVIQKRLF